MSWPKYHESTCVILRGGRRANKKKKSHENEKNFSTSPIKTNTTRIYINKSQQDATVCRYLFTAKSLSTCFGCPRHPSSGEHKTVTAASGTIHSIWATTFLQPGQIRTWLGHVGRRLLRRYYDLYQRLQLQLYVLLMMGAMDTRNT